MAKVLFPISCYLGRDCLRHRNKYIAQPFWRNFEFKLCVCADPEYERHYLPFFSVVRSFDFNLDGWDDECDQFHRRS